MKKIIINTLIAVCVAKVSFAAAQSEKDCKILIDSPQKSLSPERGFIAKEKFALLFVRPCFVPFLASVYGDAATMRLVGNGSTVSSDALLLRFQLRAEILFNKQDLPYYVWAVLTPLGVSGVIAALKDAKGNFDISYILNEKVRGRSITQSLIEAIKTYIPQNASLTATAHPDNRASCKTLTNAGFKHRKTDAHPGYGALRNYYERPSQEELDGREVIYFTYSGRKVLLSVLMSEVEQKRRGY